MKIYSDKNVWEAALERMNFLFDEFEEVTVGYSGGKDSTVIFELAKKVALERGRRISVLFIDQEAEWNETIEMVRYVMSDKIVDPYWYQIPIRIENATSFKDTFLYCWEPGKKWLREKEPISIKENTYGVGWWYGIFGAIFNKDFAGKKHCCVSGVRCEESPGRHAALINGRVYKHITWGNKKAGRNNHFTFYPLYDWSYTDIWKAINDNGWKYNKMYDLQYQYGVSLKHMRISSLHHETAVDSLFYLQEVDHELYDKLVERLGGVDMAGKMGYENYFIEKVPYMFSGWREYGEYLAKNLIKNEKWKQDIKDFIDYHEKLFKGYPDLMDKACRVVVQSILANDYALTKLKNFKVAFSGLWKQAQKKRGFINDDITV